MKADWKKSDDIEAWLLLIGWYSFVALIILKGLFEHGVIQP